MPSTPLTDSWHLLSILFSLLRRSYVSSLSSIYHLDRSLASSFHHISYPDRLYKSLGIYSPSYLSLEQILGIQFKFHISSEEDLWHPVSTTGLIDVVIKANTVQCRCLIAVIKVDLLTLHHKTRSLISVTIKANTTQLRWLTVAIKVFVAEKSTKTNQPMDCWPITDPLTTPPTCWRICLQTCRRTRWRANGSADSLMDSLKDPLMDRCYNYPYYYLYHWNPATIYPSSLPLIHILHRNSATSCTKFASSSDNIVHVSHPDSTTVHITTFFVFKGLHILHEISPFTW